jgi:Protein of unknown function (DUF2510)
VTTPGWYPDPNAPGQQRWWDGQQWTDHTSAAPRAAAGAPARDAGPYPGARVVVAVVAAVCLLLMIVGSVGTWASVESTGRIHVTATKNGTDGDGVIIIVLAVLALTPLALWALRVGPPAARLALAGVVGFFALVAVVVAIVDLIDIDNTADVPTILSTTLDVSSGWGLWLVLLASIGLLVSQLAAVLVPRLR